MKQVAEEKDLFKACQIIFGSDLTLSREFLEYIQMPGVKSAFRKRAMESHPDRARLRESEGEQYVECHFRVVKDAYDTLCTYLTAREKGYRIPDKSSQRQYSSSGNYRKKESYNFKKNWQTSTHRKKYANFSEKRKNPFSAKYGKRHYNQPSCIYRGGIPKRRLLFGHYLYYMGIIDWHSLVKALVWQRRKRYKIGEIARKKGWLTSRDIQTILKYPLPYKTFGQRARARGLLTDKQIAYLLCQQKKQKKKIGEYFLEKDILNRKQLAELLLSFHRHNNLYKSNPLQADRE